MTLKWRNAPMKYVRGDAVAHGIEDWRTDYVLATGWALNTLIGFYIDPFGVVHMQGVATNTAGGQASGNLILTLPAGYWPSIKTRFLVGSNNASGAKSALVDVDVNGQITWISRSDATAPANNAVSFVQVSFRTPVDN